MGSGLREQLSGKDVVVVVDGDVIGARLVFLARARALVGVAMGVGVLVRIGMVLSARAEAEALDVEVGNLVEEIIALKVAEGLNSSK